MLVLNGRDRSPFTRRAAIALALAGIEVDRVRFTAWDDLSRARQYNPLGRIPSLVLEDGEVIFDSVAIIDYVCEIMGDACTLFPRSGPRRRQVYRYSCCAMGIIEKAVHSRYERVMRPPEMVRSSWLQHNLSQARNALAWLEAEIDNSAVYDLDPINLAVVDTVVMLDYLPVGDPDIYEPERFPALEALRARARGVKVFAETDLEKERRELDVAE